VTGASIKYGFIAFDLIIVAVGGGYGESIGHATSPSTAPSSTTKENVFFPVVNIGLSWFF